MQTLKQTFYRFSAISLGLFLLSLPNIIQTAKASPSYSSPSYGVDEVFFGSGGVNDANSANYNARASLGDLGVGNSSSTNFQAYAGFTTDTAPFIELTVNATDIDMGTLDASTTGIGTASFTIRTWLAEGYVITNGSTPPKNGNYTITTLNTPTTSTQGAEQFGINLRDNTTPNIGANPVQIPDSNFSYGQVSPDYNNPDQFKYLQGDTIAFSNQSTSVTEYTISYIMNVSSLTPGGIYAMEHDLVATSTY